MADERDPAGTVRDYYARYAEETRLEQHASRLEYERTVEVLARELPAPPAVIVDVGGAAGAYSALLATRGYSVHLVDLSPRLVDEARRRDATSATPIASMSVGDARS